MSSHNSNKRIRELLDVPINCSILSSLLNGEKTQKMIQEEQHQIVKYNLKQLYNAQLIYQTTRDGKNWSYGILLLGKQKLQEHETIQKKNANLDKWL